MKVIGGGLAGLAATARLAEAGAWVDLHEARAFLGGRAASIPADPHVPGSAHIDNCQHVLLRCCTSLLDFYRHCGVRDKIVFHDELHLVTADGTVDTIRADALPVPFHLLRSLLAVRAIGWADKLSVARCLRAMKRQLSRPSFDPDSLTFTQWLRRMRATNRSIRRFWRPFVVSALNEEPEIAAAGAAMQVFCEGLLGSRDSYQMGVPAVPLSDLYDAALAGRFGPSVRLHLRSRVRRVDPLDHEADYQILAVPFDRVAKLVPELRLQRRLHGFETSPITGIHLWFDRPIMDLPHAMLVDGDLQWIFDKGCGYYLGVISASRAQLTQPTGDIVEAALRQLEEAFPKARTASLEHSRVIKETRATFSARPGLERQRPGPTTALPNVFLAGDWTATGWPATMEGAVRSGYRAAEAVLTAAGGTRTRSAP